MDKSTFATALKENRKRIGLSQERMAYLIGGISARSYSYWEKGQFAPNEITMASIVAKLSKMKPVSAAEYKERCLTEVRALRSVAKS